VKIRAVQFCTIFLVVDSQKAFFAHFTTTEHADNGGCKLNPRIRRASGDMTDILHMYYTYDDLRMLSIVHTCLDPKKDNRSIKERIR
jgi:hypothetical protein